MKLRIIKRIMLMGMNSEIDAVVYLSTEFPNDLRIRELKRKMEAIKVEMDECLQALNFLERMQDKKKIHSQ